VVFVGGGAVGEGGAGRCEVVGAGGVGWGGGGGFFFVCGVVWGVFGGV